MGLRWERQHGGGWFAYSGDQIIGMVVVRYDGAVAYVVDGVKTRHVTKGSGTVKSEGAAKRAVERAWQAWLDRAGLQHKPE